MSAAPDPPDGPAQKLTADEAATLAELTSEFEVVEAPRVQRDAGHPSGHVPPRVELGRIIDGGLAPAIAAIVERGVQRRPHRANRLAVTVEVKVTGPYPATRIEFGPGRVLVEDGAGDTPTLQIEGALPDLVSMLSTPIAIGGVPNPITPRGRAALSKVATGRVRFVGPLSLRREILALLTI